MKNKIGILIGAISIGIVAGMALTVKLEERYIFRPLNAYIKSLEEMVSNESEENDDVSA